MTVSDADATLKFSRNGAPLPFPGNTVISMIDSGSPLGRRLAVLIDHLRADCTDELAFLPASSWHMTLIGLALDMDRSTWPDNPTALRTLADADRAVQHRLAGVKMPDSCVVTAERVQVGTDIRVVLTPDARSDRILRDSRDEIARRTGIRHDDHDSYRFHITLAYVVRQPSTSRRRRWESLTRLLDEVPHVLKAPELRFFDDMTAFELDRPSRRAL